MKQSEIFLSGEGDNWFKRNHDYLQKKDFTEDPVVNSIKKILFSESKRLKILEIGCGEAKRLEYLKHNFDVDVYGIEPSTLAVNTAKENGIDCYVGTADRLPFESSYFDVLIFGFCLYLCDEEDLFKISQEADRVSKNKSWVIINDFYAKTPFKNKYHHKEGVNSHKMDFTTLFSWNPNYSCFYNKVFHHDTQGFTDDQQNWVAISILRKFCNEK